MKRPVVIVGGGLAGIAAAVRLVDAGETPVLIETRKQLGGRATSFVDPRSGLVLDNCQHVLLGCCTNLIDLYDRLGVLDLIEWHDELFWTRGRGEIDVLRAGRLPAPFHLAGAMRRMTLFTRAEKRRLGRAMWRMIRLGAAGRLAWRDRPFSEFLESCDQPPSLVRSFWSTVVVSACNLDVERVAASTALKVFQDGFLANRWSYTMGLASVPLSRLYDPAVEVIEGAARGVSDAEDAGRVAQGGGTVRLGCSARAIGFDGKRVTGVITDGGLVEASAVIAAVPPDRLAKLVSPTARDRDRRLASLERLGTSPIVGVHLHFAEQAMDLPHLVVVERGVQWLFNKGTDEQGRQHVHAVVSAADEWMGRPEEEIVRQVLEDIAHVLPGARGLDPVETRVIKEKRATFAATPAAEALRPSVAPDFVGVGGGGIPNLYLAGDWCDTGWPATMEGAVRSGYEAAGAITGGEGVVEDVPAGWLAARLGLK